MTVYKYFVIEIKQGDDAAVLQDFLREHEFDLVDFKFVRDFTLFLSTDVKKIDDVVKEFKDGIFKVCR